jgi:hypothetical protein
MRIALGNLVCVALMTCGCGERTAEEESEADLGKSEKSLSKVLVDDRAEMRQYLAERAKDVVFTGTTKFGDLVECIPVVSQSSLHTPEMEGQSIAQPPKEGPPLPESDPRYPDEQANVDIGDFCPTGTIPRLAITLESLERFGSLKNYFQKSGATGVPPIYPGLTDPSGYSHWYAQAGLVQTNYGAGATFNIWAPYTDLHDFSLSQLWNVGGTGTGLQTLEAGWQRYPDKYGDTKAHLFIFSTSDGYQHGCYNLDCSRFVQTYPNIVIGGTLTGSTKNGTQQITTLSYQREAGTGHWWLYVQGIGVGYYPATLFSAAGIRTTASTIIFGGEIASSVAAHRDTNMGSSDGDYPSAGYGVSAYTRTAQYRSNPTTWSDVPGWTPSAAEPLCYDIATGYESSSAWKRYFYFGGPGRHGTNCP